MEHRSTAEEENLEGGSREALKPSLPMTCCCYCSRTSHLCLSQGVFRLLKYKFQCNQMDQIVQVARASVLQAFSRSVVLSSSYSSLFTKEEMQQEGLSNVIFSVSSFSFVINTYIKELLVLFGLLLSTCFQFQRSEKKAFPHTYSLFTLGKCLFFRSMY